MIAPGVSGTDTMEPRTLYKFAVYSSRHRHACAITEAWYLYDIAGRISLDVVGRSTDGSWCSNTRHDVDANSR